MSSISALPRDQWLGVELRHLAALAAVAEEGSFRGAADRLGYVQSAISQQIAFLERLLSVRLLERSRGSRPVTLTDPGRVLLEHVEEILGRLGAARADLAALEDGRAGEIRLGLAPSVEAKLIPLLLTRLAVRSRIQLVVRSAHDDDATLLQLADNDLDAAIVSRPVCNAPYVSRPLLEDPYVLLVQSSSPLARRGTAPSAAELAAISLITRRAARDTQPALDQLSTLGIQPKTAHRSDDDATTHALVAAGIGAAILPALSHDAGDERVTALPLDDVIAPRRLTLAWHGQRTPTAALETVVRETVAASSGLAAELGARAASSERAPFPASARSASAL
jgi:DNA-binding transcriptional LysR family regulator